MKKFAKYTQMDWRSVQLALSNGTNPKIKVTAFRDERYGWYPGSGHVIHINDLIVKQYGVILTFRTMKEKHNPETVEKLIDEVERRLLAVVLHEMVHWGDYNSDKKLSDKLNQKPDWGTKWEREKDVYGESVSNTEIPNLWGLFIHKNQVVPWDPKLHTGLGP